jgi:hypothetical protein
VSAAGPLEGRYRRLLAIYPAGHRRQHQDEMLGVLMTGARAGQRWPGLRDSVDLVAGALRIRLRPPRDEAARRGWADALALTSVVLPVLFLAYIVAGNLAMLAIMPQGRTIFAATLESFSVSTAAWVVLTALVLLRLRRLAGVAAAGLLAWFAVSVLGAGGWYFADPGSLYVLVALALEAIALLASPGPRRGMQLMTRKRWALAVLAPAAVRATLAGVWLGHPAVSQTAALALIVVVLTGMILTSPLIRRLAILLSVPAYYVTVGFLVPPLISTGLGVSAAVWDGPLRIMLSCLPIAVAVCLLLPAAFRSARHTPAGRREA